MERYKQILKIEKIRELLKTKNIDEAITLADTLNIQKIKNVTDLCMVAEAYQAVRIYEKAKQYYQQAYDKNPTRRILLQLIKLSIKMRYPREAEGYLDEYEKQAPNDYIIYIYRYNIAKLKDKPIAELIVLLKKLCAAEYIDKWAYELVKLYHRAGMKDECIRECNEIILWFGYGEYVDRAKALLAYYNGELSIEDLKTKTESAGYQQENTEDNHESEQSDNTEETGLNEQQENERARREAIQKKIDDERQQKEDEYQRLKEDRMRKEEERRKQNEERLRLEQERETERIRRAEEDDRIFNEAFNKVIQETINDEAEEKAVEEVQETLSEEEQEKTDDSRKVTGEEEPEKPDNSQEVTGEEEQEKTDSSKEVTEEEKIDENETGKSDDTQEMMSEDLQKEPEKVQEIQNEDEQQFKPTGILKDLDGLFVAPQISADSRLQKVLDKNNTTIEVVIGRYADFESIGVQLIRSLEILLNVKASGLGAVISGGEACGKTTLAKGIAKLLYMAGRIQNKGILVIDSDKINNLNIAEKIDKLRGYCILIQKAGQISSAVADVLVSMQDEICSNTVILLEDERGELTRLFRTNMSLNKAFSNRINMPGISCETLYRMAGRYLKSKEYTLDSEAAQRIEMLISEYYKDNAVTALSRVSGLLKNIVENTEKRYTKGLSNIVSEGKLSEYDMSLITLEDIPD